MSATGIHTFDSTVQESNLWLHSVMEHMQTEDPHVGFAALKGTLHAVRDRVGPNHAVGLGAQLPMVIRGLYYEGWRVADAQTKERHKADFLDHVRGELPKGASIDPERAVRAVFSVMWEKLDPGETAKLINLFPIELRNLWPEPAL